MQNTKSEIYVLNPETNQIEMFVRAEIPNTSIDDVFKEKPIIDCLKSFLELAKLTLRTRSFDSYKDSCRLLREYLLLKNLDSIKPIDFSNSDALNFSDYMISIKRYAGRTHNGHKQHLGTIFNDFKRRSLIKTNPFLIIRDLPENTQRHVPFNDKEKKLLKEYFERHNPRLGAFCQVQYYLAIRPLELLQVQIRDINMSEKYVMIWSGNAKNRKQEAVYFPTNCKTLFNSFKIHKYQPTDYLFGHKLITCGKSYNRNRVSELHSAVIKDLNLNSFHTLYSWKHTGACAFHKKYKDIHKLMRHLRHNDVRMTMLYIRQLGLEFKVNNMPKF